MKDFQSVPTDSTDHLSLEAYRGRIYRHYLTARDASMGANRLANLASRAAYLEPLIRRHIPADRKVHILDLGCGHGALLYFLQRAGYTEVVGVDRSAEQVALARSLGIAGVCEGDMIEVLERLPKASQDVVIAFDVIEHFTKAELVTFVDHVRRVLKPGGRWLIHAPNAESPFGMRARYADFTHEQAFTRHSLAQLLQCSGFAQVDTYEERSGIRSVKGAVRAVLWRFFRAFMLIYLAVETGAFDRRTVLTQNLLAVAIRGDEP